MSALGIDPVARTDEPLLEVTDLAVRFRSSRGEIDAVEQLSLNVYRGESVAIVGESGSGKSVSMQAILGLYQGNPRVQVGGTIKFDGTDLSSLPRKDRRLLRGARIALIAQDALASMNPSLSVGYQIAEPLMVHRGWSRKKANARAAELLDQVGIPSPVERLKDFPHQFSGGMRQRALIAMGLALDPDILIADEPTTALDVTIQAQVLRLLSRLRTELGMSLIIITHDMGVVARVADRVTVMYAGAAVESGTVREVFARPRHPYTEALLQAMPRADRTEERLYSIPGTPPSPRALPSGCRFHPRCAYVHSDCDSEPAPLVWMPDDHATACRYWKENGLGRKTAS